MTLSFVTNILHLQGIPRPAHFRGGRGETTCVVCVRKIGPFMPHFQWWLPARDRELAVASNVGSVK